MNYNWAQISYSTAYQAHLKKTNVCLSQKGVKKKKEKKKKEVKSQEVIFPKSQKLLISQARRSAWIIASTVVTSLPLKLNE